MTRRLVPRGAMAVPRRGRQASPVRDPNRRYRDTYYGHMEGYGRVDSLEQENVDLQAMLDGATDALEDALVGGSRSSPGRFSSGRGSSPGYSRSSGRDRSRQRERLASPRSSHRTRRRESWGSAVADISSEEDRGEEARTPQQKQSQPAPEPEPEPARTLELPERDAEPGSPGSSLSGDREHRQVSLSPRDAASPVGRLKRQQQRRVAK